MVNIWLQAINKPSVETYQQMLQEESEATVSKAVMWVALAGVITGVISMVPVVLAAPEALIFSVIQVVIGPIIAVIGFVMSSWLFKRISLGAFGGKDEFSQQTYLLGAVQAPMSIIAALVSVIPVAGQFLALPVVIYNLYLTALVLNAVHDYGRGKAFGTIVIGGVIMIVLVGGLVVCPLLLFGSIIGDVYQNIQMQQ